MNDRVADYRGLVESSAAKFADPDRPKARRAEYDDLVQEGLIAVWQTLERGLDPSQEFIEHRMFDWMRTIARQTGRSLVLSLDEDLPPLDEVRVVRPQE
jgi:DNA-directed RNA polymerase specialized sigma24 family protein